MRMNVGGVGLERDGKMGGHLDGFSDGGVSRLEVVEGPTGRQRRTKAERARIAAESLVPGTSVTEVARRHGTTRWQVYDWRKKLRDGQLVVPESVAALPMFAELVVEGAAAEMPAETEASTGVEIVVGDVVIRVGADADEALLTRSIRAVRAVGHYGEIFEANLGAKSPLGIPRGLNQSWATGGILYAPPIR